MKTQLFQLDGTKFSRRLSPGSWPQEHFHHTVECSLLHSERGCGNAGWVCDARQLLQYGRREPTSKGCHSPGAVSLRLKDPSLLLA